MPNICLPYHITVFTSQEPIDLIAINHWLGKSYLEEGFLNFWKKDKADLPINSDEHVEEKWLNFMNFYERAGMIVAIASNFEHQ